MEDRLETQRVQIEAERSASAAAASAAAAELVEVKFAMRAEIEAVRMRAKQAEAMLGEADDAASLIQAHWRGATVRRKTFSELLGQAAESVLVFGSNHVDINIEVERLGDEDANGAGSAGLAHGSSHLASNDSFEALDTWTVPGGKGINFAAAISQLGVPTHFVSILGTDSRGEVLHKYLRSIARSGLLNISGVFRGTEAPKVETPKADAPKADAPKAAARAVQQTGSAYITISRATGKRMLASFDGTNALVGEREVAFASNLLRDASARVRTIVLALEIPLEPMLPLVAAAKEAGVETLLRLTPLSSKKVAGVRELLSGGGVVGVCGTVREVRKLCGESGSAATVADAESAARSFLYQFEAVQFVIVTTDRCHLLRERRPSAAASAGCGSPSKLRVHLKSCGSGVGTFASGLADLSAGHEPPCFAEYLLPTRRIHYQPFVNNRNAEASRSRSRSAATAADRNTPVAVGSTDAFLAGFAAARTQRRSVAQCLVWAYGTCQLVGLLPSTQFDGNEDDVRHILERELGGASLVATLVPPLYPSASSANGDEEDAQDAEGAPRPSTSAGAGASKSTWPKSQGPSLRDLLGARKSMWARVIAQKAKIEQMANGHASVDAESPQDDPLSPEGFLGQNEMHRCALRGLPSHLPVVPTPAPVVPTPTRPAQPSVFVGAPSDAQPPLASRASSSSSDAPFGGLGSLSKSMLRDAGASNAATVIPSYTNHGPPMTLEQLAHALSDRDAFGFTPAQRASDTMRTLKPGTSARKIARRVVNWILVARVLLSASGHSELLNNPLLSSAASDYQYFVARVARQTGEEREESEAAARRHRVINSFNSHSRGSVPVDVNAYTDGADRPPLGRSSGRHHGSGRLWGALREVVSSATTSRWDQAVMQPFDEEFIVSSMLHEINQIDGERRKSTAPLQLEEATHILASHVISTVLEEIVRRHHERQLQTTLSVGNLPAREVGLRHQDTADFQAVSQEECAVASELEAADHAELALVEAVVLPVLRRAIQPSALKGDGRPAPPSTGGRTGSSKQLLAAAQLEPLCKALLNLRDARTGWTLMHLAAGAGLVSVVEALLALEGKGSYSAHTKSYCGDSVLHVAVASAEFEVRGAKAAKAAWRRLHRCC